MKFILISRHTNGAAVPPEKVEQNLKELGEWVAMLKGCVAMPTRGGKVVTQGAVSDYDGDLGGVLIFEAGSLAEAVELAKESPGLKYGFTHEIFPEISVEEASRMN